MEIDWRRWPQQEVVKGDASSRCYLRLRDSDGGSMILVRYPSGPDNTLDRDLQVLRWLQEHHLRVPLVSSASLAEGWALLEDLGERNAEQTLRATDSELRSQLALRLVKPLSILATLSPEQLPSWNQPLAQPRLRWELAGFELWYLWYRCGIRPGGRISHWLDDLAEEVAAHPRRVCHRDYHLNNLFFMADGDIGVIDFQDILLGPDTYDASSLVYERAFPELFDSDACESWLQSWAVSTGAADGWRQRCRLTRLQRGLKVLGTFARLERSGRVEYSRWIPSLALQVGDSTRHFATPDELCDLLQGSAGHSAC
jgi:aminoglycoside/choline kinase family phosphotransferase